MKRRPSLPLASLATFLWLWLGAAACGPKTERLVRVAAERAPLFAEPEEDEPPQVVLHAGDLVTTMRKMRSIKWKGPLEGAEATREGEMLEVLRSPHEGAGYLFQGDLGDEITVPAADWICKRMGGSPKCTGRLRRIALPSEPGGLLAYEACYSGPCSLALVRGRDVQVLSLDGIAELRFATVNGQPVALATTRWMKSPQLTGGSLIVVRLTPRLGRGVEIVLDEVNTSHNTVRLRHGTITVSPDGIRFKGAEKLSMPSGAELSSKDIDETYRVAPVAK